MAYQNSVETHTFSSLYVADTVLKEQLKEQEYKIIKEMSVKKKLTEGKPKDD